MALNNINQNPIPDADDSTVYTALTPPESADTNLLEELDPFSSSVAKPDSFSSSIPWPDSTFIIRSVSSGDVLTLFDGQVVLARPGGRGSIHWACVEENGWLGFRNIASGQLLGHNIHGNLCCRADNLLLWEKFCARMTPEGGYVLLLTHWEKLWYVGVKEDWGVEKLAKIAERSRAIVWEFVKV